MKVSVNLYLEEKLREKARKLAEAEGKSLSQLFSEWMEGKIREEELAAEAASGLHPLVRAINPHPVSKPELSDLRRQRAEDYEAEAADYESHLPR